MASRWKKKVPPRKPWVMIRREIVPYVADTTPYEAGDSLGRTRPITRPLAEPSETAPSLNERQLMLLNRWGNRPKPKLPVTRVKHSFYTVKDGAVTLIRREVTTQ